MGSKWSIGVDTEWSLASVVVTECDRVCCSDVIDPPWNIVCRGPITLSFIRLLGAGISFVVREAGSSCTIDEGVDGIDDPVFECDGSAWQGIGPGGFCKLDCTPFKECCSRWN